MPLCGSSTCGCAIVSVPAATGAINGHLPTIDVAGNGTTASPWNLTLNDEWAAALPKGTLDYASVTANQGSITTIVDLTGMTVTFTASPERLYRIVASALPQSTVAGDSAALSIATSANVQVQRRDTGALANANVPGGVSAEILLTGLSGSVTYKARMARQFGSGTITANAVATVPMLMYVEDVGLA
jgi:hypothetical protein